MQWLLAKWKGADFASLSALPPLLDERLRRFGSEIVLVAITVLFAIIYHDYIFFEKTFVHYGFTVDSVTQFYPFYSLWIDQIRSLSWSPWSFHIDLGFNFYTMLVNFNPFDLLLLAAGKDHFVDFLPFVMLLKFVAAGLFFHGFLRRINISPPLAIIGSLLYTFSGYMVINVHWYHYPNYAVLLAVVLYFFERWLQTGKWLPLALVLGFLALKGELQIFQLTIFFLIYGGYRLAGLGAFNLKNYAIFLYKAGLLYAVGIAMSSYVLLPSLSKAGSEGRVGEAMASAPLHARISAFFTPEPVEHLLVILGRFFNNDLWGAFGDYSGFLNYFEGPSLYCGLLVIIALPALVLLGKKAITRGHLPLLLLLSLPLLFPEVRSGLNFFASGTFKYQTLFISTFLIIIVMQVITPLIKETRTVTLLAASALGLWLFLRFFPMDNYLSHAQVDLLTLNKIVAFIAVYGCCFLVACYRPIRPFLPYILLACVVTESALWNSDSIEENNGALPTGFYERGDNYHDPDIHQALAFIKEQDQGIYRIARGFHSGGLNDSMLQDYYGVSGYVGVSGGLTDFYTVMGYGEYSHRLSSYRYGLRDRVLLHSLLGVKYYLDHGEEPLPGYRYVQDFGEVKLFANDNWLPLGFVRHRTIDRTLFESLETEEQDRLLLSGVVTGQEYAGIGTMGPEDLSEELGATASLTLGEQIRDLRTESFEIEQFSESRISGKVEVKDKGLLAWSIPYDPGWQIRINGRDARAERVNFGFLAAAVEPGIHRVELRFVPRFAFHGAAISILLLMGVLLLHRKYPVLRLFPATLKP